MTLMIYLKFQIPNPKSKVNYPAAELRGIKNMKSPQDLNVTLNSVQGLVLKDSEISSE
jgi:hypothetical protein